MPETSTGPPSPAIPGIERLEPIGRGGFGTVYRGWQPELRRAVAVKVLDARAGDPDSAARFRREAMAMGALSDHPNVVPVYAIGTVDDRLYLVMPFLADGSLADRLASGPVPAAEVARLGTGLADALAAAHDAGVLHRDVKPANVLRTPYGALQLADFGIARFVDTTQTMGAPLATVAYAAPEVLAGEPAAEASDVYSLGATLLAALLGRPPYEARADEAPIALAVRVLSDDPPDLRAAGVPSALADVVERAMARDPAERYATAAELRDALDAVDLTPYPPDGTTVAAAGQSALELFPVPVPLASRPPNRTDRVVVAPSSPDPGDGSDPDATDGPRRSPWIVVGLGLALALGLFLVSGLGGGADGDDGELSERTATTAPSGTETPPSTAEATVTTTTTAAPVTTTTAAPVTTTTAEPASRAAAATMLPAQAVRDYYALMDAGRIDEGFARLSPAYQERTGERSYRRFWESVDGVEVLDAQGDGLQATATLRYRLDDGSTSTERVTLRFIEDPSGAGLLIDDYRVG
ncbi:MAG: serine/threonine-protein kinase [Acidimicrobiales bacterium]